MDLIDVDEGGHPEEEAVEDGVEVDEDDRPSSQLQNLAPVDHDFCGDIDDDDDQCWWPCWCWWYDAGAWFLPKQSVLLYEDNHQQGEATHGG